MLASEERLDSRGAWLAAIVALSAAPAARIGDVQLVEMAQLLTLLAAAALVLHARSRVRLAAVWREYAGAYTVLLCACAAVSIRVIPAVCSVTAVASMIKNAVRSE